MMGNTATATMNRQERSAVEDLLALVDRWTPYVASRVHARDVDDVLQSVRETVLRRATDYDPTRGEPGAFVWGIVRVTVTAARRRYGVPGVYETGDLSMDEAEYEAAGDEGDPLQVLVDRWEEVEWATLVAGAASTFEWQVILAFAETGGTSATVAELLGVRPEAVRKARQRVAALARCTIAATTIRDQGDRVTLEGCVPAGSTYAAMLPHYTADLQTAADILGISLSAARAHKVMLRRLADLVHQVHATHCRVVYATVIEAGGKTTRVRCAQVAGHTGPHRATPAAANTQEPEVLFG